MKIADLEFFLVEIARTDSPAPVRSLLVRLATERGLEGWGEAGVPWRAAELADRRSAALSVLAGRDVCDIQELLTLEVLSPAPLRCAVEMACWDLVARTTGQPLCNLFGGRYRQRIPLAVRLTGRGPARLSEVARALAEQGFYAQILTSCTRPEEDVQTLSAVRASAGARTELRFDGGAGYDLETARDLCAQLEYESPKFFVDPLRSRQLHALAALARQTSVPLAVWRAIQAPADVLATVRCGAASLVVIDLGQVGGLTAARNCAAVAEAGGLPALLACEPSLGVATAAMLQMAAATAAFAGCHECALLQLQDHLLAETLEISDGMILVPHGPGLGVEVDRGKVEKYQVT